MHCSPEQKNPRIWVIVAALLVLGGITYSIPIFCEARGIAIGGALFQFITVIAVVAAVFIVVRYKMTHFTYSIHPRSVGTGTSPSGEVGVYAGVSQVPGISHMPPETLDFTVDRSQGSRAGGAECVLSLADLVAVYPLDKNNSATKSALRERYREDGYVYYDYTVTLGLTDLLALVFIDGNRYVGIFIEPDDVMRDYLLSLGKTKKL